VKTSAALSTTLLGATSIMASSLAIADGFIDHNEHGYVLTLDRLIFVNGGSTGDANLSISECP
jgi:hypothetical protein